jgi:hypothetical protein
MADYDENSYIIVVMDCHGADKPLWPLPSTDFKIAVGGDCGNLTPFDDETSHAIYSTCAEYNSKDRCGRDAAAGLGARLKASVLPSGRQLTRTKLATGCRCSEENIFKVSSPSYEKLFSFAGESKREKENFGIFIVGMLHRARKIKGVTHNPPVNIKEELFTRTGPARHTLITQNVHHNNQILLSTLLADLKRHYNVANVVIVDYSCRAVEDPHQQALGRTLSIPHKVTTVPMTQDDNPTPRAAVSRCPHPCTICQKLREHSLSFGQAVQQQQQPQPSLFAPQQQPQPSLFAPQQQPQPSLFAPQQQPQPLLFAPKQQPQPSLFAPKQPQQPIHPHQLNPFTHAAIAAQQQKPPQPFLIGLPAPTSQQQKPGTFFDTSSIPFAQAIQKHEQSQQNKQPFPGSKKGGNHGQKYKKNSKKRNNKKYISRKNNMITSLFF